MFWSHQDGFTWSIWPAQRERGIWLREDATGRRLLFFPVFFFTTSSPTSTCCTRSSRRRTLMPSSSKGPSRASQAVCRPLGKITFILFDPSQSKALLWEHMHERRLFVFFFIILFFFIIYCQWCNLACFTLCWTSWLGEAQHYASLPILSGYTHWHLCTG